MKKLKYEKPELEIIRSNEEEFLMASGGGDVEAPTPPGTGQNWPTLT